MPDRKSTPDEKPPGAAGRPVQTEKEARLAAKLRENLKRRKAPPPAGASTDEE